MYNTTNNIAKHIHSYEHMTKYRTIFNTHFSTLPIHALMKCDVHVICIIFQWQDTMKNVDDGADDAVDDGTQSSSSFSSWHLPLASNLQALELQSNDDTMSIASSQSFMMAYELLENDDTASMSSFQMVANTAPSVVDPDEQQEQQQQQDQEPDAEPDAQEPNMDALSIEGNVASSVGDDDPDAQQQDAQGINLGR